MKAGYTRFVSVIALIGLFVLAQTARADRGGWADPAGGWDIVYEGGKMPLTDGWYNLGGSDDPVGYDADDVTTQVVAGVGDTEDGSNPAADAIVLRVQDNSTGTDGTGRKIKFTKPFEGTYAGTTIDNHLINVEGGVTICVRWRVTSGTLMVPAGDQDLFSYRHYCVGIDGVDGDDGRCGLGIGNEYARWCRGDDSNSTPIAVGEMRTGFRTFWIIMEKKTGDQENFGGTVYLDGGVTPAAPTMWGPGDTGADGVFGTVPDDGESQTEVWINGNDASMDGAGEPEDNRAVAAFGQGATPLTITIEYDYICFKKGVHVPTSSGPPAAPSNLTAAFVNGAVELNWSDNSANEDGFAIERRTSGTATWTEIAQVPADVTTHRDSDNLQPATTYFYQVRAVRGAQFSAYTNEAQVTTPSGSLGARGWRRYVED